MYIPTETPMESLPEGNLWGLCVVTLESRGPWVPTGLLLKYHRRHTKDSRTDPWARRIHARTRGHEGFTHGPVGTKDSRTLSKPRSAVLSSVLSSVPTARCRSRRCGLGGRSASESRRQAWRGTATHLSAHCQHIVGTWPAHGQHMARTRSAHGQAPPSMDKHGNAPIQLIHA